MWFFDQINVGLVTVDFDSTVSTREGKQERAALGYNPNRQKRNSHHPLLAFISETKMNATAWLHPGNTTAFRNYEAFIDETFEQVLGEQAVSLVRADSSFYAKKIMNCLEASELNYIIAVCCYPNIKHNIYVLKDWVQVCDGIDVCEFTHCFRQKRAKARRHFVVRK